MTTKAATHMDRSGQNQSTFSNNSEYYGTLAKEVYAVARKENWTAEKVKNMLANPKSFEKYLSKVRQSPKSFRHFVDLELQL